MKQTTWWIIGIIVVIILAAAWYFTRVQPAAAPVVGTPEVSSATSTASATATYACDGGKTITATYYQGAPATTTPAAGQPPVPTGSVVLAFSDAAPMTLMQTLSADGGRYANSDESFVFWDKGQTATVLQDNQEKDYTNCTVQG